MPNRFQFFVAGEFLQILLDIFRNQRRPTDDAANEIVLIRQFQQPARFLEGLSRLYADHAIHVRGIDLFFQIGRQKVPLQDSLALADPAVFLRAVLPEVMMGIDDVCHHTPLAKKPPSTMIVSPLV